MKILHVITFILVIVGGINWGLVGLGSLMGPDTDWNIVHMLLGSMAQLESIVYVLVGLSAVVLIVTHKGSCSMCASKGIGGAPMSPQGGM
jgi:uncharacterized membrane protein YuzA (DUF378 family)